MAFLMTVCGAGLRLSEACHLKIEDVEGSRGMLRVAQGKENKDRYTVLSPWLLEVARGLGEKFMHFLSSALSFEACEVRCVKV